MMKDIQATLGGFPPWFDQFPPTSFEITHKYFIQPISWNHDAKFVTNGKLVEI